MSRQAGDGENRGPPALVITGASSGIGYATARLAIEQDWLVFGSVRKEGDAEVLKDELERRLRHSYSTCVIRLPYLRKLIRDNATRTQSLWNRGGDCRAGNGRHSDLADPEGAIGRYGVTDYGEAFDKGMRAIVDAGHQHSLEASDAQHVLPEQALPRAGPKRATDFIVERALCLKPDPKRAFKGISV